MGIVVDDVELILHYNGFHSVMNYSTEDKVFYGKIDGITDLVNYEGDTIESAILNFKSAVDDYLSIEVVILKHFRRASHDSD